MVSGKEDGEKGNFLFMTKAFISIKSMDLHYADLAFKETSLKKTIFNFFSKNKEHFPQTKEIHALRNINIEIKAGERVALLGHNGAGKSTFLRSVAELYPISGGSIEVVGKVRALFDLNLGFEAEATGRENILYRGLSMGLPLAFIREKEEEIIDFSGIRDFIHYPIKTYSSGMLVRLAFSISTIAQGDILLLDEVMGVGDKSFVEKAKDRTMALIEKSEILILASHDSNILCNLCERGLLFRRGQIVFDGTIKEAIKMHNSDVS